MPNRSTLMTGRMPSLHGVRSNGTALNLRANTFVDLMRVHGYRTALLGKSHLQNMTGMPALLERQDPPEGHLPPPPDFAEAMRRTDAGRAGRRGIAAWLARRPGLGPVLPVLRLRARRPLHRARRQGGRALLAMAQGAPRRSGRPARARQRAAARLHDAAGVADRGAGGALSHPLRRRAHGGFPRGPRERGRRRAVLRHGVVSPTRTTPSPRPASTGACTTRTT